MEYRRTGRGGAGNFYSKKDIIEASKASKKAHKERDLEAQKPREPSISSSSSTQSPYRSSGRGGAGNVTQSSTPADKPGDLAEVMLLAKKQRNSKSGYYGRGGAGNHAGSAETASFPQERELQIMKRTDIYSTTEAGLQEPQKVHLKDLDGA